MVVGFLVLKKLKLIKILLTEEDNFWRQIMFGKKKKAEAAKAEQEASKKTDGRILLYSDIIDALYDEMPREEREALLEAK